MKYVATYTLSYGNENGGVSEDSRFVSAETLDDLYVKIAQRKFEIEYDCYDPEDWRGLRSDSSNRFDSRTFDWRIYQEKTNPFDAEDIPAFKKMVAIAEASHDKRKAKRKAERTAQKEIEEREILKTLLDKFGLEIVSTKNKEQ